MCNNLFYCFVISEKGIHLKVSQRIENYLPVCAKIIEIQHHILLKTLTFYSM